VTAPDHHDLPLCDYDHLPLPSVAERIRPLSAEEITELLQYERAHAHRPLAIQIFRHRLDELGHGAQPTAGRQQRGPDYPPSPHETSPVSPRTAAPPMHPPPHGDPAQPGKPKGDRPPI
jgi:hypothetical protein